MRFLISFILAICISVSIFFGMDVMTSAKGISAQDKQEAPHLIYLRDSKESKVVQKKRVQPKKPKVEKIKDFKIQKTKLNTKIEKDIKIKPILAKTINLSSLSPLDTIPVNVNSGLIDANSLMTLSKRYPRYPRRAKMQRKEGHVKLQFQIDSSGYVKNPKVLESNPKGVFDKSALKAINKWRFKPTKGANKADLIDATITFNYRLTK